MSEREKIAMADTKIKLHKFYLRRPKSLDVELLAERLMALSLVSEIVLDCDNSSYTLDVRFIRSIGQKDARSYLATRISGDFGALTDCGGL